MAIAAVNASAAAIFCRHICFSSLGCMMLSSCNELYKDMIISKNSELEIAGCQWPKAGHILEMAGNLTL
jgi:hypothetical protein